MRHTALGFVAVTIFATGCGSSNPAPPRNGYRPPAQAQQRPPGTLPTAPQPAAGGLPGFGFRLPVFDAAAIPRAINVQALLAALPASPCKPAEVSPGNWVGFDCTPPSFVRAAIPFAFQRPQAYSGATVGTDIPASIDHRGSGLEGPIKNQGAVGTCTAVSLSTAMEHQIRRLGYTENISALHIWSNYAQPRMGMAGDSNVNKAITSSKTWPYDPAQACKMMDRPYDSCGAAYGVAPGTGNADPVIQAARTSANANAKFRLLGVERLTSHDPAAMATIISGGDSLWVAFNVNTEAWKTRNMQNGVIQDYNTTESTGHAVVLSGFRKVSTGLQFQIHNSWGKGWGEGGYAWISDKMVGTQLRYAYRVRVADPKNPLPSPSPQPGGRGGCPSGQAKDVIYGQCVAACPSGHPPAAGLCAPSIPGMPSGPQPPSPAPGGNSGGCANGQTKDMMTGQCVSACPNGQAPIGGLCLPTM